MNTVDTIIPAVARWIKDKEKMILEKGIPLPEELLKDAKEIGINHPELIRVMVKEKVDVPNFGLIRYLAEKAGLPIDTAGGMAFGYGVEVVANRGLERRLVVHELVHVRQYERLGFANFIKKYILDCIEFGYYESPLELEADEITDKLCGKLK